MTEKRQSEIARAVLKHKLGEYLLANGNDIGFIAEVAAAGIPDDEAIDFVTIIGLELTDEEIRQAAQHGYPY